MVPTLPTVNEDDDAGVGSSSLSSLFRSLSFRSLYPLQMSSSSTTAWNQNRHPNNGLPSRQQHQQQKYRHVGILLSVAFVFFQFMSWRSTATLKQLGMKKQKRQPTLSTVERFLWYRNQSQISQLLPQQTLTYDKTNFDQSIVLAQQIVSHAGLPWSDMDWSTGHATSCGFHKCFFTSSSNSSVGYLLSTLPDDDDQNLDDRNHAYKMEQDLVQKYGIPQVSMEPPSILSSPIPPDVHTVLDAYTHIKNGLLKPSNGVFHKVQNGTAIPTITIQKVWKVPEPNLLIGFLGPKHIKMQEVLPAFVRQVHQSNHQHLFQNEFSKEIERTQRIVHDETYKSMLCDYHGILTTTGRLYLIDMDGHFSTSCAMIGEESSSRTLTAEDLKVHMTNLLNAVVQQLDYATLVSDSNT
ncbi:hypothetical protein IV203_007689 [Nitzschia inconspicua]|uniref:Uncharacterized protein n=1 Tax=Nitzschia inconspicua TaxID=303405 RepID=A0A9K3PLZ5_9STRA|nr:hypothetical protein IV203_007689 [Nitzschia inconspicua]